MFHKIPCRSLHPHTMGNKECSWMVVSPTLLQPSLVERTNWDVQPRAITRGAINSRQISWNRLCRFSFLNVVSGITVISLLWQNTGGSTLRSWQDYLEHLGMIYGDFASNSKISDEYCTLVRFQMTDFPNMLLITIMLQRLWHLQ